MKNTNLIIAIDGPAGSGKGELANLLSQKYNLMNISSGSFYRAFTFHLINVIGYDVLKELLEKQGKDVSFEKYFDDFNVEYSNFPQTGEKMMLNGEDISDKLRCGEVNSLVSYISENVEIRKMLNKLFLKYSDKDIVMDGRDIATVVFTNANLKIYLDADVDVRAKRRFLQNKEKGIASSIEDCLENLKKRDHIDKTKDFGRLVLTDDYKYIDNTNLTIEQTVDVVSTMIEEIRGNER